MNFHCDKCGLCCRNLKDVELYAFLDDGTGVCKYLKGNLCSIYDDRPLVCRVEESYSAFFKDIMSEEEYLNYNYIMCNNLKQKGN